MSGHHEKINEWRKEQSIMRTRERRPICIKAGLKIPGYLTENLAFYKGKRYNKNDMLRK